MSETSRRSMQKCAETIDRVLPDDATDDERDRLTDLYYEWELRSVGNDRVDPREEHAKWGYRTIDYEETTPRDDLDFDDEATQSELVPRSPESANEWVIVRKHQLRVLEDWR